MAKKIVKPTADSTKYFQGKLKEADKKFRIESSKSGRLQELDANKKPIINKNLVKYSQEKKKAVVDVLRQSNKGRVGYDSNGYKKK